MNTILKVSAVFVLLVALLSAGPVAAATFQLSGRVTDQSGNPLAGSIVEVLNTSTMTVVASTTTDTNGNYAVSVDEGTYDVRVTPSPGSGFQAATASGQSITSDTVLDFVLVPAQTLVTVSGRITDRFGNGVANAQVGIGGGSVKTDANGRYARQVRAGQQGISIRNGGSPFLPQGYHLVTSSNVFTINQDTTLDVQVPSNRVFVHVQDPAGNPVANVGVNASRADSFNLGQALSTSLGSVSAQVESGISTGLISTDASGTVVLWLLPTPPGIGYNLFAYPPAGSNLFEGSFSPLVVTEDDVAVTITLPAAITVSGRITDRFGNGVANAQVGIGGGSVNTDANGRYARQVRAGQQGISIRNGGSPFLPQGYHLVTSSNVFTINQDTTLDVQVPSNRVFVHVQDPAGNPVANVGVNASRADSFNLGQALSTSLGSVPAQVESGISTGLISTDASGTVVLWLLPTPPGIGYNLFAYPPAGSNLFEGSFSPLVVTEDDVAVTITLPAAITVSGRITDRFGNGVANAQVGIGGGSVNTDANGRYARQVRAGQQGISIRNGGSPFLPQGYHLVTSSNVFTINQDTTLDVQVPSNRVFVHVQDPAGNPVANVGVNASRADSFNLGQALSTSLGSVSAQVESGISTGLISTDASGTVVLWLLPTPPGIGYNLFAYPPAGSPFASFSVSPLTVNTDKTIQLVLQFVHPQPVTTATLFPAPDGQGIYPNPVMVTLSASAYSGFAVAATDYAVDGGSTQTYLGPFTISDDGPHSIKYWSIDNAGVYETPKYTYFNIASLRIVAEPPLPTGTVGVPYSVTLEAEGGTQPYTWSIVGGALPPGLNLNETTGEISGAPTTSGTFGFTIQVQDSSQNGGLTAVASTTVTVNNVPPTIVSVTNNGPINEGSSATITVNATDPAGANDPLSYEFDCNNDSIYEVGLDTANSATCAFVDNGNFVVNVRVSDGDGGDAAGTTTAVVDNVAPTVNAPSVIPEPSTEGSSVVASASFSDPGTNDAPFTCSVNYDDGLGNLPGTVSGNTCTGPAHIYSTFGSYSVAIAVTDKDGGTGSTAVTHIVIFNWAGFFQPIDNLPTLNSVKAGQAIPVKFSLGGNKGLNIFAAGYPLSQRITCDTSALLDDIEQTDTPGSSGLSYDPGSNQYHYVWKTEKSWAGTCRQLVAKLIDGTTHVANFKFK